jgi:transketolase
MNTKLLKSEAIREAYGMELARLGKTNPEIVVLDADVSKSTRTCYFAEEFPERFINFGIAEQNMMSAAAGMALAGLIPFVNSFCFLNTYRAADQFRTSIAYPNLHVIAAGTSGGLSDSLDGPTHQTVSDIAWVRAIPNVSVVVPTDAVEIEKALPVLIKHNGPVWLRLCREKTPVIHNSDYEFRLGKAEILRDGKDIALIGCGIAVPRLMDAAHELIGKGYDPMLISMPTIKPLDEDAIFYAARKTGAILTCEEHNIIGGLGAAVCETVTKKYPVPVLRLGVPDTFAESGGYDQLLDKYGLKVQDIIETSEELIKSKLR